MQKSRLQNVRICYNEFDFIAAPADKMGHFATFIAPAQIKPTAFSFALFASLRHCFAPSVSSRPTAYKLFSCCTIKSYSSCGVFAFATACRKRSIVISFDIRANA